MGKIQNDIITSILGFGLLFIWYMILFSPLYLF